ncbi:MAG: mitochondrial domain protein [Pseudomonadota bacterium]|jgi:glyoxylase-like metal-dependent hydrolase (beta-lactamase superfamily II)/rhodanese-related sulfurtransferase
MLFRQLFDPQSSTYTYLLADATSGEAILIDTVFEQHLRDLAMLRELGLRLRYVLDTHVHADHITGAWRLRDATGCHIGLSASAGAEGADLLLRHGDRVVVGGVGLTARATPGHTDGCMSYVTDALDCAFTGDALLIRGAGRTDFQQGDAATLYRSVREQIFSLPPDCRLYPGHDYAGRTMTTVAEERAHNPRLGDVVREQDFVGFMANLGLPHPKRMADAVPANLRCGKPSDDFLQAQPPAWAPLTRSFAGIWQVEPAWVHDHAGEVLVLDVREPIELGGGSIRRIDGALEIPLSQLAERAAEVPRDRPVVAACPTGARSARATQILEQAGVQQVANLRGGIVAWQEL